MNTLEVDYNSLSPEDKKLWVKAEMERQRLKFRTGKGKYYKGIIKK